MNHPLKLMIFATKTFSESQPKRTMQPHSHGSLEISYVLSGTMVVDYFSVTTQKYERSIIFPNQFIIFKPNAIHACNIPSSLQTISVEFFCEEQSTESYLKNSPFINSIPEGKDLSDSFNDILIFQDTQNVAYLLTKLKQYSINENNLPFTDQSYDLDIKRLFIEILRCTKTMFDLKGKNLHLKKALTFIESNYHSPINAKTIANHLGISSSYLQKIFHNELNTSLNDEILRTRVDKACILIQNTNYSLSKISKLVGFNTPQSFISNFKKFTNVSPSVYKTKKSANTNFTFFQNFTNFTENKF